MQSDVEFVDSIRLMSSNAGASGRSSLDPLNWLDRLDRLDPLSTRRQIHTIKAIWMLTQLSMSWPNIGHGLKSIGLATGEKRGVAKTFSR